MLSRLCGVTSCICLSAFETSLFRTAFVMVSFGAFRISELVLPNKVRRMYSLTRSSWRNQCLKYSSSDPKTDQLGKGHWLSIPADEDVGIFPVGMVH